MGQLTVGAAGFPPLINPVRAFRGGCGMVGYGYGGLGSRPRSGRGQAFRGDDGLGVRTSFEIVSNTTAADWTGGVCSGTAEPGLGGAVSTTTRTG